MAKKCDQNNTNELFRIGKLFPPAVSVLLKAGEVNHPVNNGCGEFFEGFWIGIKRRGSGTNDRTGFGKGFHVVDMNKAIRGVAGN